ncbi:hypothetical protein V9K67_18140 [Paraflavisolibacter sp. H34]|uniref:hypothetical protein n=1 Tax=Huijunlia imazamoxiresistens TaxID=3127457 RepID=UPI003017B3BC
MKNVQSVRRRIFENAEGAGKHLSRKNGLIFIDEKVKRLQLIRTGDRLQYFFRIAGNAAPPGQFVHLAKIMVALRLKQDLIQAFHSAVQLLLIDPVVDKQ